MTPDEADLLHDGLLISAAHLRNDGVEEERLLKRFLSDDKFPRLADAFIYVALLAADLYGTSMSIPFQQVLQSITPRSDVILLAGLPVGSWDEVIRLASAVKRSGDEARRTPLSMDVPSAINIAFRLAISALTDLTNVPQFAQMAPEALADMFAKGIEEGHANG
jgi:hypothetical protein